MQELVEAQLADKAVLGGDVATFVLVPLVGSFRDCEAGAHVDVHLLGRLVRNYSLIDWDPKGRWVQIGVKREESGRGGSRALHALALGEVIRVSQPRNRFRLEGGGDPVVLVGGGIGVTPLLAMARTLRAERRAFELHYLVRSHDLAAFEKTLEGLDVDGRWHLHCDDRDGPFDFEDLLSRLPVEARYYVCGPEPLVQAVRGVSDRIARGVVTYERFGAGAEAGTALGADADFEVSLGSTGERLEVPAGRSILSVLREAGHDVDYACSEGACGTCVLDVLDGEIDHRDSFLTAEEREAGDCMCICVSRARGPRLVLDL